MNLFTPCMGSIPIVESKRPSAPLISPFTIDFDDTPAIIVSPNIDSQKYSGEPNFMASCPRMGAKKYNDMHDNNPPKNDAIHAVPNAFPA